MHILSPFYQATVEEVSEILQDAEGLARWWPSVYLDVKVLDPGDERGIGKVVPPPLQPPSKIRARCQCK
jgi:hypothetical protein